MGQVFVAERESDGAPVAVKLLDLPGAEPAALAEARRLFYRESRALMQLDHPSIVRLIDARGVTEDPPYLVTELVRGHTLRDVLDERGTLPWLMTAALLHAIASALAHAHERQLLHRDLKPENILWTDAGRIVLIDFGLAHAVGNLNASSPTFVHGATRLLGTPAYFAPELLADTAPTLAVDLFALGCMGYEALTGVAPFAEDDVGRGLERLAANDRAPLVGPPGCDPALVTLIEALLDPEPARRPRDAATTLERLVRQHARTDEARALLRAPTVDAEPTRRVVRERGDRLRLALVLARVVLGLVVMTVAAWGLWRLRSAPLELSAGAAPATERAVSHVVVTLRLPAAARIALDGQDLGVREDGARLALPAGHHVIEAQLGARALRREVTFFAATSPTLVFE